MGQYKYPFEKHPAKKGHCPECGKPNVFRYYAELPREFGKCERINECGYHRKPDGSAKSSPKIERSPSIKMIKPTFQEISELLKNSNSNFHSLCSRLKIPADHLSKWNVGTYAGNTAFIHSDRDQSPVNIKFIPYDDNGHRNKKIAPHYLKSPSNLEAYGHCLYGLHLLREDKIICLVESEKTAVIASFFYPDFDWLATGGSNGLTEDKLKPISTSKLIYIGDADQAGKSNSSLRKLKKLGIAHQVLDLFEDRNDGYDLADAIADGKRPEIKFNLDEQAFNIITEDTFLDDTGKINRTKFMGFLNLQMGIHTYRFGSNNTEVLFLKFRDGIAEITDSISIKQEFLAKIEHLPEIHEKFLKDINHLFGPGLLTALPLFEKSFLRDEKNRAWFAFQNTLVSVTRNTIEQIPYTEKYIIWSSNILKHEFVSLKNRKDLTEFAFYKFLRNISGSYKRFKSLLSAIGYTLHDYYDVCKAIILTDSTDSNEPEGRTGKSLLAKATAKVRNSTEIDGKEFKADNRFRFQSVSPHTQIINFNDVGQNRKAFDFEQLFTVITEGAIVEQKGRTPFNRMAKILISSNRPVKVDGGSSRDRAFEFELSNYYSEKFSPRDEFGHSFFEDWTKKQWNLFFNLMLFAVQIYLKKGLISAPPIHLERRKLIYATTKDSTFLDFAEEEIVPDIKYNKTDLFQKFKADNDGYAYLNIRGFNDWLKKYSQYKNFTFKPDRSDKTLYFTMLRN